MKKKFVIDQDEDFEKKELTMKHNTSSFDYKIYTHELRKYFSKYE